MLPPYELEGKIFKRVMKGYNTAEVDEHIDFIVEKYKELYRAYNDLEKRYATVSAELLTYKENEESIRHTLESSQTTGEQMLRQAKERSEIILRTAREECDAVLDGFKKEVADQIALLKQMRSQVAEFKADIFARYQQHIEFLESLSPDTEEPESETEDYAEEVIGRTMGTIVTRANAAISGQSNEEVILRPVISGLPEDDHRAESDPVSELDPDPAPETSDEEFNDPDEFETVPSDEPVEQKPANSGDTMKFHVLSDVPAEFATDEEIIFGKNG
ncbi:MAG: DivIVA domain-containing protein [Eubacteriales bacterium]